MHAMTVSGAHLFAGSWYGVYVSADNGLHWTRASTGLPEYNLITSFAVMGAKLYVGTTVAGVWRRPIAELVTTAVTVPAAGPADYTLDQNYPNPFNPSTTIRFSLPTASFVSLKIFDVMGREIEMLAAEKMDAGAHSRVWNAAGRPSGVCFYRLHAGACGATRRLVVIK